MYRRGGRWVNGVTQGALLSYGEIGDCEQSTSHMRGTCVEHSRWGPDRDTRTLGVYVKAGEQGGGGIHSPPKQKLGWQSSPRFGAKKHC